MMIGPVGIWLSGVWLEGDRRSELIDAAAEMDELGFAALWMTAGFGEGIPSVYEELLAATRRIRIASGILSIWHSSAEQTAAQYADLRSRYPERFILGLGVSHASRVAGTGQPYVRPYSRMVDYLDALDRTDPPVTSNERVLAALGPRMLRLAAARSAGAHPYFVTPEHTAFARQILGAGPLLAPEQAVVLESDPGKARDIARHYMERYLAWPSYTANLYRLGWKEADVTGGGSDRLVDAVVAWGTVDQVAQRIGDHHRAGADSVCVQVLSADPQRFPRQQFRDLASALL